MKVHDFAGESRSSAVGFCLTHIGCLVVCILALWVRFPRISEGMPYFYQEDEAHHFNRTVDMVKSGDLNPHYFHKPSLHFYLRIPFVASAFISEVKAGGATSVKEIRTRDPYGLSDYSFSASHPRIVTWNRAFSVTLSILTVLLTYTIALALFGSASVATLAGALASFSPEFIRYSGTIGVDVVMTFFVVLSVYVGIRAVQRFSFSLLCTCAITAGLAVSSKYNALPIMIVPLVVVVSAHRISITNCAAALALPWLGFIAGSPFILTSLPLFLDHLAYEVWHYGIAGHEGHMAEPGLPQLEFYLSWLSGDGIGLIGLALSLGGIALLGMSGGVAPSFLAFPLLFFALMVGQRANFTRNMVVIIPFVSICAAAGFAQILSRIKTLDSSYLRQGFVFASFIGVLAQPFTQSVRERSEVLTIPESRVVVTNWLKEKQENRFDTAVSGQLQFAAEARRIPGIHVIDESSSTIPGLFQAGFSRIAVSSEFIIPESLSTAVTDELVLPGQKLPQRIIQNPEIRVIHINPTEELIKQSKALAERDLRHSVRVRIDRAPDGSMSLHCDSSETKKEDDCWLSGRYGQFIIVNPEDRFTPDAAPRATKVNFKVMTPWENQTITVTAGGVVTPLTFSGTKPGDWIAQSIEVPAEVLSGDAPIFIALDQVHSPSTRGLGPDTRRLGVAVQ